MERELGASDYELKVIAAKLSVLAFISLASQFGCGSYALLIVPNQDEINVQ